MDQKEEDKKWMRWRKARSGLGEGRLEVEEVGRLEVDEEKDED